MRTALYATHPILAVSVLERDARGCWSTSHRPLSCRCGCNRACTEHDMDAGDMPGQYEVSRAPRLHTVHIRFSGPSNVHEICPRWTRRRLSWPEPDATRPRSRGLGRASTSPPRAAVAVAVIGRAVVATHVRRTAATTHVYSPVGECIGLGVNFSTGLTLRSNTGTGTPSRSTVH